MSRLFPSIIEYQPYSICNANCAYCPVGSLNRIEKTKGAPISEDVLNTLINHTKGRNIKKINPHYNCEPLLAKNLADQIKLWKLSHPNAIIDISTNGVFLTNDKILELEEAGLDILELHYMGVSKEYHEKAMQTKFDKVKANIEKALELKRNKKLNMKMYIFSHRLKGASLNEWYEFGKEWKNKGADFVLGPLWNRAGWYGKDFEKKRKGFLKSMDPAPCSKPFQQLAVEFNGEVSLCSLDYSHKVKIGNIMRNTIDEIWNNPVMRRYQEGQNDINKLKKLDLCNDCIRGGRYYLDESLLTKLMNREFSNKFKEFFYKRYLDVLDRI